MKSSQRAARQSAERKKSSCSSVTVVINSWVSSALRSPVTSAATEGSPGKLVLHMLGAVAQFERDLILERTRAGLTVARKNGKRLGPPAKWDASMAPRARAMLDKGELSAEEVAGSFKISRRTLFRGLKAARDHEVIMGRH